ncbi:UDP-N-acetylmuramate dehydrogenase, partial [Patescibacteria group bacterium]|nr:UDP-N-acetylmuramate dehydrogenase [Patescibacteria group bacterium]
MNIERNKSLKPYTTFLVEAFAKYFVSIENVSDLRNLITDPLWQEEPHYILGRGSNVLFTKDFNGIIVYNQLRGITLESQDDTSVTITVGSGEDWHEFVLTTVKHGWWGIENLTLIPGTVGAAPVQNIGAYGVEAKDTIVSVDVIDLGSGKERTLANHECHFSYRNSIFKQHPEYFVTRVRFQLSKKPQPKLTYDALNRYLNEHGSVHPTQEEIMNAVIAIRRSKLPDVGSIGMAGSFFKNPIISREQAETLETDYPDIKYFDTPNDQIKVSAAWLIEHLGYKGVQNGSVGTYDKHALV